MNSCERTSTLSLKALNPGSPSLVDSNQTALFFFFFFDFCSSRRRKGGAEIETEVYKRVERKGRSDTRYPLAFLFGDCIVKN